MKYKLVVWGMAAIAIPVHAQQQGDSIRQDIRNYVARNFSEIRTFNFTWKAIPSSNYNIKSNNNNIEEGTIHYTNNIKFNATVPVVKTQKLALYAIGEADFYNYHTENANGPSVILSQTDDENRQYYRATLNAIYHRTLWKKPFLLNASISFDGYNHGIKQALATLTALSILHRSETTSLSAGMAFVWPYNTIPVMPIITLWHLFSQKLSIDITMPKQFYFRYQMSTGSRLSLGSSLDVDQFYFRPQDTSLPSTCYFSSISLNTEVLYEYILSHHFYFYAKGGMTGIVNGGIYKTNRKEIDNADFKYSHSWEPFISLGVSYNLFK